MPRLVEIALPLPIKELFTYKIPEDPNYNDVVGKRVFVPFGKQYLTGVIVGFSDKEISQEIKPIIEIIDEKRIFSEKMLKLTKWISEYYYCSWGDVLKAAMPPNFNLDYVKKIKIEREPTPYELDELQMKAPKRAKMLRMILYSKGDISVQQLQKEIDIKNISPQLEALIQKGFISVIGEWEKQIEVKVAAAKVKKDILENEELLSKIFDKLEKSAPKQVQILSYLILEMQEGREYITFSEILSKFKTTQSSINALKEKGFVDILKVEKPQARSVEINLSEDEKHLQLTNEQQIVFQDILKQMQTEQYSGNLLYGVTGSGKTLVYVKLIEEAIKNGKQVLYLLPEISLTPQIVDRVRNFFGDKVAVLHSKMTDNERNKVFTQIQNGDYQIVLGVRSAVFCPFENLGLIIVDEEHDASYKQNHPAPRYNARDTAIVRAKIEECAIVLGSATPSLESWQSVKIGNLQLYQLLSRADEAKLPTIEIVDMREERKEKRLIKSFSANLIEKIQDRLNKNEGVILFQNRRGYAPQLYCPDCGNVPICKNCDIALTYHKKAEKLVCHYCGYLIPSMKICNVCGSDEITEIGAGTEKIEEELKIILEEKGLKPKIARFDRDSTSKKDSSRRIMYGFINGDIDILVGTQMLTKGIDIGRVTLVGIINADMHLFFPDFRSNERTFQIITQVSGRAGRKGNANGEVIIQTSNPQAYAIELASNSDFKKFAEVELSIRKQVNYPPFCRMSKIEFLGRDFEEVKKSAYEFSNFLPKNIRGIVYIGPVSPSIVRINSQFRQLLFIKSEKNFDKSNRILHKILSETSEKFSKLNSSNSVKVIIDIDSYQNM
jgi:primosomal protein N' (replication factor Y)